MNNLFQGVKPANPGDDKKHAAGGDELGMQQILRKLDKLTYEMEQMRDKVDAISWSLSDLKSKLIKD